MGDRGAVDELLRRHYDYIYAVCRRIAGNETDANDCVQEALIAIVKGLEKFDSRSAFRSWSYRVATNACLDELRRKKRRPVPTDLDIEADVHTSPTEDRIIVEQLYVDGALSDLDESFRTVIVLRDIVGMEYKEISECLDIPMGTVRSRISRARQQLLQVFEQSGNKTDSMERHK